MPDTQPPLSVAYTDATIYTEVVKLLVQVAWADLTVEDAERRAILAFAKRHELPEATLDLVDKSLEGSTKLQAPNLALLRPHRRTVMAAMRELLTQDLRVPQGEEEELLKEISELLG